MGADRGDAQGVAIGCGARNHLGADGATSTATVLDHHRLTEFTRHALGGNAADDVGRAARRKRNDQLHRLGGPGAGSGALRLRRARQQPAQQRCCHTED
jgi:hypothetical protein